MRERERERERERMRERGGGGNLNLIPICTFNYNQALDAVVCAQVKCIGNEGLYELEGKCALHAFNWR